MGCWEGKIGYELLNDNTIMTYVVLGDWEAATEAASKAGIRVVQLRFGVILSPGGGALAKMLTPFRLGLGGRIGNGRQWIAGFLSTMWSAASTTP